MWQSILIRVLLNLFNLGLMAFMYYLTGFEIMVMFGLALILTQTNMIEIRINSRY